MKATGTGQPTSEASDPAFTADSLMEIAAAAERRYRALAAQFGPGIIHDERDDARREMEDAIAFAACMAENRVASARYVGPFGNPSSLPGERIRVAKGVRIFGTGPAMTKAGIQVGRALSVTVHSIHEGSVSRAEAGLVRQPTVHWAGSGGYWRWTDLNNVAGPIGLEEARGG